MTEKYAIGAQASGFISLAEPVQVSTSSTKKLKIPSGMINIGGPGKGLVIESQTSFTFVPTLTQGSWVLYASVPATPTGIVDVNFDSYSNYIGTISTQAQQDLLDKLGVAYGDTSNRRAFCYFIADSSGDIDSLSIRTVSNFDYENVFGALKKSGFYVNKDDFNFAYRGQHYDEAVTLDTNVVSFDVVYKNIDGKYYQAIATDTIAEKVIGIAEKDRDNVTGNDLVMASGFIEVGTTIMPDATFPAGTYVYLSSLTAGAIVRGFDKWTALNVYSTGERISTGTGMILEATPGGTSHATTEPVWGALGDPVGIWTDNDTDTLISIGDDLADGGDTLVWRIVAIDDPVFIPDASGGTGKKIRLGTSIGNGTLLLQSGAGSIDDHDESAHAHIELQNAMNKGGLFVQNEDQGKTTFEYRGQFFDENATFSGVSNGERKFVYLKPSTGVYNLAQSNDTEAENVIGISYGVAGGAGTVVSQGFFAYDTTGFVDGDSLYLSTSAAGNAQNTQSGIRVGTVIVGASTITNGGLILLQSGAPNELDDHDEGVNSHSTLRGALAKAGIFVPGSDNDPGAPNQYVGQEFDEDALFSGGVAVGEPVYFDGTYQKALADGTIKSKIIGVAVSIGTPGVVASHGFCFVGTTLLPNGTYPAGQNVFLDSTSAGTYSASTTDVRIGISLGNGLLLVTGVGLSAGIGDITFEDITYINMLDDIHYEQAQYNIFDLPATVTAVGAVYNGATTSFDGVNTNTLTQAFVLHASTTYTRMRVHVEADTAAAVTISIDDGTTGYVTFTQDEDKNVDVATTDITLRITYNGTGSVRSYGVFYDVADPVLPTSRLLEIEVLASPIAAAGTWTIPNSGKYVNNGKSLKVYRKGSGDTAGQLMRAGATFDYEETDNQTLTVRTSGGWATGDTITAIEDYTQIDVSQDNTTRLLLEHDTTGRHVLTDQITGTDYYVEVHNGNLQVVPV